jgi:hypothetical protein
MGLQDLVRDLATYGKEATRDFRARGYADPIPVQIAKRLEFTPSGIQKRAQALNEMAPFLVGNAMELAGETILPSSVADYGREIMAAQSRPPSWNLPAIQAAHARAKAMAPPSAAKAPAMVERVLETAGTPDASSTAPTVPVPPPATTIASHAERIDTPGDKAARAKILSGGMGAFVATPDPWNPSGRALSPVETLQNERARTDIDIRHQRRLAAIEAAAEQNDPMRKKLEAETLNRAYEEVMPFDPRPLYSTTDKKGNIEEGQFRLGPKGEYINTPPAPRLGEARKIELGARDLMIRRDIFDALAKVRERLADEVKAKLRTQESADMIYESAREDAALRLDSLAGKSLSDYFKPDPYALPMAPQ